MVWIKNYFPYAGFIRIPAGEIYHYAIYISDDEIIQFGEPPSFIEKIPDSEVHVCVTTLSSLLKFSDYIEGAEFDTNELSQRLDVNDTISRARSLIGSGGYSFLFNNCEHFVYSCVFGKPYSSQTEDLRRRFNNIPVVDAYIAKIPDDVEYAPLCPPERYEEILRVSNQDVKKEKYCAWRLLRIAIQRSLGYDFNSLKFERLQNGKWISDKCEISITHSTGLVAVAVSKKPIGIDIEKIDDINNPRLPQRVLSSDEYADYSSLPNDVAKEYFIKLWTQKEAYYKYSSEKVFSPENIAIPDNILYTERLELDGAGYYLSVVSEDIAKLRIFRDIKL